MAFTLYIIRHGETDYNLHHILQGRRTNLPLNATGKRQAHTLFKRFEHEHIDLIATSTMVRARQTATSIHEAHPSVPFIECEDFEEINWGEWEGQPFCELDMTPYFTEWKQGNFDIATPGGESPAHVRVRLERAMKWLLEHVHDKRHVVLVAHGRLIRILLAMLLDHSLATMEQYNHHNTCVNVISCTPSDSVFGYTFTAVSLNETWHLMQYM